MALQYHQALFDLLEQEPRCSDSALRQIVEREQEQGFRFPESVREWFSMEGVGELFETLTNSDELVSPEALKVVSLNGRHLLHVATENQGVFYWFVDCNGSDDPPLLDDDNQIDWDDEGNFDFSQVPWRICSYSFSSFLFGMLTGTRFGQGVRLSARDSFPDSGTLQALRNDFQEGPSTDAPELRVLRFFQADADLVIRSNTLEERVAGTAHWHLIAPNPDVLERLANRLWHLGTLAETLQPAGTPYSSDAEQGILDRLRSEGS